MANNLSNQLTDQPDQRRQPRIDVEFIATVRGMDVEGRRFEANTLIDNLSTGGLHLRLPQSIEQGMKLFIAFQFSAAREVPALQIAAHGVVRRVEKQPDGSHGVAVMFQHYRAI